MPKELLHTKQERGFSVVELVISAAVLSVFAASLAATYITLSNNLRAAGKQQQATALAEESLEAVRNIRDDSYAALSDGTYGLAIVSNKWAFSGSSDTNGIYTRQTQISTVNSNQKQVTSTVTWQERSSYSRSVSITSYLTNWRAAISAGTCAAPGITPTTYDNSGSTAAVIAKPTGVAQNDLLFAYIGFTNASYVLNSIPSGWVEVGHNHNGTANEALFYKVAGSSEPASYSFGLSVSSRLGGTINVYRGCFNVATPIDVISNTQYVVNNDTYRAAAMNLPSAFTTVVMFPSVVTSGNKSFAAPVTQGGGWTEDYNFGNASSQFSRSAFSKQISSAGSTGVIDSVGSFSGTTQKHAFAVGLKP